MRELVHTFSIKIMEEIEKVLEELGFSNEHDGFFYPYGEFYSENGERNVCLRGDGVYAYTVGTAPGEDILEMYLNFLPSPEILKDLLKQAFCLQKDI